MQKAGNAVKDVTARKESAEDLGVPGMDPFSAEFPGVLASN